MGSSNEGPSDPATSIPPFGDEDTRKIVLRIQQKLVKQEGASTVWRTLGGIAVTVALGLAAWGVGYAQQAAVDHERVDRHDEELVETRSALAEMQATLTAVRESQARIEGRLEER